MHEPDTHHLFNEPLVCVCSTASCWLLCSFLEHWHCHACSITDPPSAPVFTTTPQNITAKENARITFHCRATGVPTPSISWGKMTGQFPSDRSDEPSPGSLRIVDVKPSDQGLYVCAAANSEGTVAAQVYLRIEGGSKIMCYTFMVITLISFSETKVIHGLYHLLVCSPSWMYAGADPENW